jgi:hypothetical protein
MEPQSCKCRGHAVPATRDRHRSRSATRFHERRNGADGRQALMTCPPDRQVVLEVCRPLPRRERASIRARCLAEAEGSARVRVVGRDSIRTATVDRPVDASSRTLRDHAQHLRALLELPCPEVASAKRSERPPNQGQEACHLTLPPARTRRRGRPQRQGRRRPSRGVHRHPGEPRNPATSR